MPSTTNNTSRSWRIFWKQPQDTNWKRCSYEMNTENKDLTTNRLRGTRSKAIAWWTNRLLYDSNMVVLLDLSSQDAEYYWDHVFSKRTLRLLLLLPASGRCLPRLSSSTCCLKLPFFLLVGICSIRWTFRECLPHSRRVGRWGHARLSEKGN